MISVDIHFQNTKGEGFTGYHKKLESLTKALDTAVLADVVSTIMISRVRRRFLKQENPDGTTWPESKHAEIRLAGGYTYAKGGRFAPGGKKTGGNTLFASGNLFHSIRLSSMVGSKGSRAIMTDVPYAAKYMKTPRIIIGVNEKDLQLMSKAILKRLTE